MRYFTRELHRRIQKHIGLNEDEQQRELRREAARAEWEVANRQYLEYLRSHLDAFPTSLKHLANLGLHDAVVVSVACGSNSVELILNTERAPLLRGKKRLRLRYDSVVFHAGLGDATGQALLYDEISLEGSFFEYSALLEKTEMLIRFKELTIDGGEE